jgi:hypothetical protein
MTDVDHGDYEQGPLIFDDPGAEQTFKAAVAVLKSFERIDPTVTWGILTGALSIHLHKLCHGRGQEFYIDECMFLLQKILNAPPSLAHVDLTTGELGPCDLKPGPNDATH